MDGTQPPRGSSPWDHFCCNTLEVKETECRILSEEEGIDSPRHFWLYGQLKGVKSSIRTEDAVTKMFEFDTNHGISTMSRVQLVSAWLWLDANRETLENAALFCQRFSQASVVAEKALMSHNVEERASALLACAQSARGSPIQEKMSSTSFAANWELCDRDDAKTEILEAARANLRCFKERDSEKRNWNAVVVTGAAGSGKTRLCTEALNWIRQDPELVVDFLHHVCGRERFRNRASVLTSSLNGNGHTIRVSGVSGLAIFISK